MDALVQKKAARFASFKAIEEQFKPLEAPAKPLVRPVRAILAYEPHAFPESSTSPALPLIIREEMVEFYAFIFCQRGFRQLGMTFEEFLLVAAAIKPADFPANSGEGWTI